MSRPDPGQTSSFTASTFTVFSPELEAIWRGLEEKCDHFGFQSYDWLQHWHRTIGRSAQAIQPCIAVVTHSGTPVALFPFGVRRFIGVRSLEFLGGAQADYNAPLLDPAHAGALEAIWMRVLAVLPPHDLRKFSRLPAELNRGVNPILSIWPARPSQRAWVASLTGTWDEYQARISRKIRKDSKRRLSRLAAHGHVTFDVASTGEDYDAFIAAMIEQKRRRFLETGARDALADGASRAFYSGLRGRLGTHGFVHLSALRVNGTIVATHWGLVYGDRFYYLMPTFAAGVWKTMSVGRLLQDRLMQWALENGLRYFDFSVGDEPYKQIWSDREMALYESVTAVSLRGTIYRAFARLGSRVKHNTTTRNALMTLVRVARAVGGRQPGRPGVTK